VHRVSISSLVKRGWMLLVALAVVAVAGFAVYRLHGVFGSHHDTSTASAFSNEIVPFNPKHVVLEVFGAPGTVATINYLDVNLRNPANMILLERVAKAVFHTPGIAQVQSITRPLGTHWTTPRSRFRSVRKATARSRTSNTSRTARPTCSNRSPRSTKRSAFCGSSTPCSSRAPPPRTTKLRRFTKPSP
jgi:hypothetical protein